MKKTMNTSIEMKHDISAAGLKSTIAASGATIASLTLNEWVAVATLVFIFLQSALLIYKWYWMALDRRKMNMAAKNERRRSKD